jgi:hypothetical protein
MPGLFRRELKIEAELKRVFPYAGCAGNDMVFSGAGFKMDRMGCVLEFKRLRKSEIGEELARLSSV